MKGISKRLPEIYFVFILILAVMLLSKNIAPPQYFKSISSANEMYMDVEGTDIKGQKITLPYSLKNIEKGAKVHIYNDFIISRNDMMYIKTVYSPLSVMANGTEIYNYGKKGTYPDILNDPPTQVCLINLPLSEETVYIDIVYEFPYDRDNLSLSAPLYGEGSDIMRYLFFKMSVPFVLSILQIFIGAFLMIMFISLLPSEVNAKSILWLGLFGMTFGLWCLCECNFTVFIIQRPFLLYIGAFVSMFTASLPILPFTREILDGKSVVLDILTFITGGAVVIALSLQLLGIVPFHKSMFFFHYAMMTAFFVMTAVVCKRGLNNKNVAKFSPAYIVMTFFVALELVNYSLNFVEYKTLLFQIGVLFFLVITEFFSGADLRNIFMLQSENRRLSENMAIMEKQMNAQYENGKMLIETAEELKRQRHDLKHQYVVLEGFIDEKEYDKARDYIAKLIKAIPQDKMTVYCRNEALNAIFTYYAKTAEQNGISYDVILEMPQSTGNITDIQLCIIFGNLLENAIEACGRTQSENRFIKLRSDVKVGMLFITMDNSCDGNIRKERGGFISSKRDEIGTGISSIIAIAEKYGGYAKFNIREDVFESSVCVCIENDGRH